MNYDSTVLWKQILILSQYVYYALEMEILAWNVGVHESVNRKIEDLSM
jgi:hypothetical protein